MALNLLFHKEIRDHHLFKDFSDESFQYILQTSGILSLRKNEVLFKCSDIAKHFFLLRSGQITLFQTSLEGNEKVVNIIQLGETFCEANMFIESYYHSMNAKASHDSEVFYFSLDIFKSQLSYTNKSCLAMMAEMSHRLKMQTQEIIDLSIHDAQYRLVHYLLENCSQIEGPFQCQPTLKLSMTKSILASRLSITPETFSRILTRLKKQALITIKDDVIFLINYDELVKQVGYCVEKKSKVTINEPLRFIA